MSSSNASVEKLDDTDPRIVYTTGTISWDASSNWGSLGAYQNTLHVTRDTASYATVVFKGASISVNSLFSPLGANFTATLDDQVHGPINLGVPDNSQSQVKEAFRQDSLGVATQHTLVLRKVNDNANWTNPLSNVAYFNIDFISVEGTVISPSGVSTTPTATSTVSAETGNDKRNTPFGLIIGTVVPGVLILIGAVAGTLFFVHRRRLKAEAKHKVEAYHLDKAAPPTQPNSRATIMTSIGGLGVTSPTLSKGAAPLSAQPIALSSPERGVSVTTPISSQSSPSLHSPATRETTQPSAPPAPPIPRTPSPEAKLPLPPAAAPSHSETITTENIPSTTENSLATASDPNTAVLRSEIEGLREQVRLLAATRRRDPEFQSYEPPPQYSPRRPGHQSDDEDD